MPFPPLDCGCPARPAYALRRGTHEPMLICRHHGERLKAEAIRQGFVVTPLQVPA